MRWDNQIALFVFMAFMVFITVRGRLPLYMGFILGTTAPPAPVASVAPVGAGESATAKTGGKSLVGGAYDLLKSVAGGIGGLF
jgi:hypothetical protein